MKVVTTIAGSDSGGGAGIQADLKTFQELKVFGTSAITSLTAQNTKGVHAVFPADSSFVRRQLEVLLDDFNIAAMKTGMLYSSELIQTVADVLKERNIPLVVDPVMVAKGGASLLHAEAVETIRTTLLPLATIVTPNIPEAEELTGITIQNTDDKRHAAKKLLSFGTKAVVMKGGHLHNEKLAEDEIFFADGTSFLIQSERIDTKDTHGTGCTFSAAITAFIARGFSLKEAIIEAKRFIQMAIQHGLQLGHGHGPTNHFAYNTFEKYEVKVIES